MPEIYTACFLNELSDEKENRSFRVINLYVFFNTLSSKYNEDYFTNYFNSININSKSSGIER